MSTMAKTVTSKWGFLDFMGVLRVRLGIRRNQYTIAPGLYSMGTPGKGSPVFVSCNYKFTFNILRRDLKNRDCWLLILDTKGVNVWCAAGKGSFGTRELIKQINVNSLSERISHNRLILPQLGAPGMDPKKIKEETGFKVIYGPIKSADITDYIDAGFKASEKMRTKTFSLKERLGIAVTHFVQNLLPTLGIALLFIVLDVIFREAFLMNQAVLNGILAFSASFTATFLACALLPVLPGRAFSIKGFVLGIIFTLAAFLMNNYTSTPEALYSGGKLLLLLAWIVFTVLNLTGSSTYTSLSGVQKEMKIFIPIIIVKVVLSIGLLIIGGLML